MKNLNHCTFVGRLSRDGELKYTPGGTPLLEFSLCVNGKKKQGEEWVDVPNFFDFVLWGKYGEAMAKHLTKGRQMMVMSEAEKQTWQDNQGGGTRSKIVFKVLDNGLELGALPRAQGESGGQETYSSRPQVQRPQPQEPQHQGDYYEDDIPF